MNHSSPATELAEVTARTKVELRPVGMIFPEKEISLHDWNMLGDLLCQANNSLGFWIGDWINYGEARWGEKYADAMDLTGFEKQTLEDFAYVARQVQISVRTEKLTFYHHRKVAPLKQEDQVYWLKIADKKGLTARMLGASIMAGEVLTSLPDPQPGIRNHIPYVNRLVSWWRRSELVVLHAEPEQRAALKRDLQPVVDIYNAIVEKDDDTTRPGVG